MASAQESVSYTYPAIFERLTSPKYGGFRPDVGEVKAEKRIERFGASSVAFTVYYLKVRGKTPGADSVWLELPFKKPSDFPGLGVIKTGRRLEEAQTKALDANKKWKDAFVRVQADAMAAWLAKQDEARADLLEDAEQRREDEAQAAADAEAAEKARRRAQTLANPTTRRIFFDRLREQTKRLEPLRTGKKPAGALLGEVARLRLTPAQATAAAAVGQELVDAGASVEEAAQAGAEIVTNPAGVSDEWLNVAFPLPDDPAVVVELINVGPTEVYNFFMQAAARGIL